MIVIRWFLLLGFSFALIQAPLHARSERERVAAVVNGEKIPLAVVDALAKNPPGWQGEVVPDLRTMREAVLQTLIQERLWMQFLRKHGPKISAEEGEKIIQANLAVLQSQGKTLAAYCKETRQTEEQVRGRWLFEAQLVQFIEPLLTEEKLKAHFESEKDYYARVRIRPQLLLLRVPMNAPPIEKQLTKNKLQKLRDEISAGKLSFTEAAKKYSIDPSAELGGEFGFLTVDDARWDDALLKAAFQLPVRTLSEPIETPSGFALVYVHEKDPGKAVVYEQVKEVVRGRALTALMLKQTEKLEAEATIVITLPK